MTTEPPIMTVARGALIEAGRPDLAAAIELHGLAAIPVLHDISVHKPNRAIVVKAFYLAHLAAGHRCWISENLGEEPVLVCPECANTVLDAAAKVVAADIEAERG